MFLKVPALRIGERSDQWFLADALIYRTDDDYQVVVPAGFETDLASIPRIFRRLIGINGKHRLAAIVHDYLYSRKGQLRNYSFTRKECDQVFLDAMKECGVNWFVRHAMHKAVRAGGWVFWNV